jgi:hypothetical protein
LISGSALGLSCHYFSAWLFPFRILCHHSSIFTVYPHRLSRLLFTGKGAYGFLTGGKGQALRVLQKISTPAQASGRIFGQKP